MISTSNRVKNLSIFLWNYGFNSLEYFKQPIHKRHLPNRSRILISYGFSIMTLFLIILGLSKLWKILKSIFRRNSEFLAYCAGNSDLFDLSDFILDCGGRDPGGDKELDSLAKPRCVELEWNDESRFRCQSMSDLMLLMRQWHRN